MPIRRMVQRVQTVGLSAALAARVRRTAESVRAGIHRLRGDHKLVFAYDGKVERVDLPPGLQVRRYERLADVPPEELAPTLEELGPRTTKSYEDEFTRGGVWWLLLVDGECATRGWTRYGRHFPNWFVNLGDDDLVFFAGSTFPQYRGRGLAPLLQKYIMWVERDTMNRAYVDILPWNAPSIRAVEKAGFTSIGRIRQYRPRAVS